MDRDEALALLKGGSKGIQKWNLHRREANAPNLEGIDLSEVDLARAHLNGVNLSFANLRGSTLALADLSSADLKGVDLSEANLSAARLMQANLKRANLSGCTLASAHLYRANLRNADLSNANLSAANLSEATLDGARVDHLTLFGATTITTSLDNILGLDGAMHAGRSYVSIDAIRETKGRLPEQFLRGCGLSDFELESVSAISKASVRFHSCFISYSTADEAFAARLYDDLQSARIRCWKWDYDAQTGKSLWGEIDHAIRVHDKVLLIASRSSLKSPQVSREVERALRQEDERGADVLIPIRLDDYLFGDWKHERKVDVTNKVVADARGWETDDTVYETVLDRLLQDLKVNPT